MLEISCERAELRDGQDILELGCGWGSLTCWMAEHYPNSQITAISNSAPQRRHIEARLQALGRDNVTIITADLASWQQERRLIASLPSNVLSTCAITKSSSKKSALGSGLRPSLHSRILSSRSRLPI